VAVNRGAVGKICILLDKNAYLLKRWDDTQIDLHQTEWPGPILSTRINGDIADSHRRPNVVIPGRRAASNPESRDSGFARFAATPE
jgi:hypothetical protein